MFYHSLIFIFFFFFLIEGSHDNQSVPVTDQSEKKKGNVTGGLFELKNVTGGYLIGKNGKTKQWKVI